MNYITYKHYTIYSRESMGLMRSSLFAHILFTINHILLTHVLTSTMFHEPQRNETIRKTSLKGWTHLTQTSIGPRRKYFCNQTGTIIFHIKNEAKTQPLKTLKVSIPRRKVNFVIRGHVSPTLAYKNKFTHPECYVSKTTRSTASFRNIYIFLIQSHIQEILRVKLILTAQHSIQKT